MANTFGLVRKHPVATGRDDEGLGDPFAKNIISERFIEILRPLVAK